MGIKESINSIKASKSAIKSSIEAKGTVVGSIPFNEYSTKIDNIVTFDPLTMAKLYSSMEEMNLDVPQANGTMGIVYNETFGDLTQFGVFNKVSFPQEVVLDTELTRDYPMTIIPIDNNNVLYSYGILNSSGFSYIASDEIGTELFYVEYTSNDGIVYTRITQQQDFVFDFDVKYYEVARGGVLIWDEAIGRFWQVPHYNFGVYVYNGAAWEIAPNGFNALPETILAGNEAYTRNGNISGIIPSMGIVDITPSTEYQVIFENEPPNGVFVNSCIVQPVDFSIDSNIQPENIKKDIIILGINGTYEGLDTSDATAIAENILNGKTAYANGVKITGTMIENGALLFDPSTEIQLIPSGYSDGGIISAVTSSIDPDIIPENIKKDVDILGVVGTLESGATYELLQDYNEYITRKNAQTLEEGIIYYWGV